jgi:hypothetical protein
MVGMLGFAALTANLQNRDKFVEYRRVQFAGWCYFFTVVLAELVTRKLGNA